MRVLVYMMERQFRSVVSILKTDEEQLLYNVLFWYMDYKAVSKEKNPHKLLSNLSSFH